MLIIEENAWVIKLLCILNFYINPKLFNDEKFI